MPELVYLREFPGAHEVDRGHVIGMTMPLQTVIRKRWEAGELHRVTETGARWPGGNVLPGEEAAEPEPVRAETGGDPAETSFTPEPVRPHGNARKESWAEYAVALGVVSQEEAETMSAGELRELTAASTGSD